MTKPFLPNDKSRCYGHGCNIYKDCIRHLMIKQDPVLNFFPYSDALHDGTGNECRYKITHEEKKP